MPNAKSPRVQLNLNVRGLSPSATLAINERSNRLKSEGRKVYKFGLGQSPFPVPESVVKTLEKNAFQKDYLPVRGLWDLREAVAVYLDRTQQIPCTGDDVIVGPGSKELMFLLQLVYYGDLVIPRPSWVSYAPQARIIGRQVIWAHTRKESGWQLTPEELKRICAEDPDRPRILILNYPSNPTGNTYHTEILKHLAKVARCYRVMLLSDEIYGELEHKGQHVSIARFYPEGTIVSGGLSKWCGAGGWRLGVFAFPKQMHWLRDAMSSVASETFTSTSAPIQFAAVRAYEGGTDIEQYLLHVRRILGFLGRHIAKRLKQIGVDVTPPKGAFYLFPDFTPLAEHLKSRGIENSRQLCDRLLEETGVALLPGSEFGCEEKDLTARLSYVDFDGAGALSASMQRSKDHPLDDDFLRAHCPRVIAGVEALADWLKG
jgi:aspartate aminotransferase